MWFKKNQMLLPRQKGSAKKSLETPGNFCFEKPVGMEKTGSKHFAQQWDY